MHLLSILAAIYVVAGVGIELYRAFTGKKVRWQNLVVVAALVMFVAFLWEVSDERASHVIVAGRTSRERGKAPNDPPSR